MSQTGILLTVIIAPVCVGISLGWLYDLFRLRAKRRHYQKRLYMLHDAHPVFTGEITVSGKRYKITPIYVNCYIIQSPEPPVSLQKTNGVLDVDKGRVDSTLVLIRLDIEAQPIDAILTFIKKNY